MGGQAMNERIMRQCGFGDEVNAVKACLCPFCKKPVDAGSFTDSLSLKEFYVSGICPDCQKKVFD
jgi:hypothetical protein